MLEEPATHGPDGGIVMRESMWKFGFADVAVALIWLGVILFGLGLLVLRWQFG